jgi:methylmalonyl-CoA epimerase
MLQKIDHLGIAVLNLREALALWQGALGCRVSHEEEVPSQKVRVAFLPVGETNIELLEPTAPDSPVAKALDSRGPGVHHVAFEVADIRATLARLKERGFQLINAEPVPGAHGKLVAFVHPKSAGGVLIELCQTAHP